MKADSDIALLWSNWFQLDNSTGLWYKYKGDGSQYTMQAALELIREQL